MIGKIVHVGLIVSNIERSISFYRDILGLHFEGQMTMQGEATDKLFNSEACKVKVAYLNASKAISSPPLELLQFEDNTEMNSDIKLNKISISEVCFKVSDIDSFYNELKDKGVDFISQPQYFDLTKQGFGKSKAVYFRDPDGIILELIQNIE